MTETTQDTVKSAFIAEGYKIEGPKADGSYTCHLYIGEKGRDGLSEMIKWPRTGAYQVVILPIRTAGGNPFTATDAEMGAIFQGTGSTAKT